MEIEKVLNKKVLFERVVCGLALCTGAYYSVTPWQFIVMFFLFWTAWPQKSLYRLELISGGANDNLQTKV